MKQTYFLRSEQLKQNAARFILDIEPNETKPKMVIIQDMTRKLEQNALLHALFGELEKKAKWQGQRLTAEQWKVLMISAHAIATGEPCKLTVGIEGEMVNLRESSAQMSIERMTSLIEYVHAWVAMNDMKI